MRVGLRRHTMNVFDTTHCTTCHTAQKTEQQGIPHCSASCIHDDRLFEEAPQPTGNPRVAQLAQGFAFDLACAFTRDAELTADFFEGA